MKSNTTPVNMQNIIHRTEAAQQIRQAFAKFVSEDADYAVAERAYLRAVVLKESGFDIDNTKALRQYIHKLDFQPFADILESFEQDDYLRHTYKPEALRAMALLIADRMMNGAKVPGVPRSAPGAPYTARQKFFDNAESRHAAFSEVRSRTWAKWQRALDAIERTLNYSRED